MTASRMRRRVAAASLSLGLSIAWVSMPPAAADIPPPDEGWTLTFGDDFTGGAGSPPSPDWIIDTGTSYPGGPDNWGTGEVQTYTDDPANIAQDGNGNLQITPLRDDSGNWTSARIETQRGDFKAAEGGAVRIEARLQVPNTTGDAALGYWPAFWALGSPYRDNYWNWPGIGEFDVMENVNGKNETHGVLHCDVSPGGSCNETTGLGGSSPCPGETCQAGFHTYRFEWDRTGDVEELRWYVDGQQFHSVREDQIAPTAWQNMTSHDGYFLLLNVAMGGAFPDGDAGFATPTASTEPGHPMLVDYVAVYNR
ncbi:glycoside hydrolase family 16 protein [Saccharopolyspora oryzae]|uniref:Glycoside hydrolase family 16 protein n=1 Tax=Saccharopolyspora oryzae TaxID=2997343 RepID=A0ABT4V4R5_9PSEU|nr:glycoside hydrolase family 16 protein [Saccharopolyspora oryzae]MDA3628426.1 glycoside hydrolase family 16 protein [Saccharopolyspora oryzae]